MKGLRQTDLSSTLAAFIEIQLVRLNIENIHLKISELQDNMKMYTHIRPAASPLSSRIGSSVLKGFPQLGRSLNSQFHRLKGLLQRQVSVSFATMITLGTILVVAIIYSPHLPPNPDLPFPPHGYIDLR
ncbi:hypothetical protein CPB86DRAFT_316512 [Serendipita vermifera]|nr:hypothetical protein CPB86DRAFT_316512 [Serendipita vermifera]